MRGTPRLYSYKRRNARRGAARARSGTKAHGGAARSPRPGRGGTGRGAPLRARRSRGDARGRGAVPGGRGAYIGGSVRPPRSQPPLAAAGAAPPRGSRGHGSGRGAAHERRCSSSRCRRVCSNRRGCVGLAEPRPGGVCVKSDEPAGRGGELRSAVGSRSPAAAGREGRGGEGVRAGPERAEVAEAEEPQPRRAPSVADRGCSAAAQRLLGWVWGRGAGRGGGQRQDGRHGLLGGREGGGGSQGQDRPQRQGGHGHSRPRLSQGCCCPTTVMHKKNEDIPAYSSIPIEQESGPSAAQDRREEGRQRGKETLERCSAQPAALWKKTGCNENGGGEAQRCTAQP